jgi:ABC-2 type transport system permease protein
MMTVTSLPSLVGSVGRTEMPIARLIGAYANEIRFESLRMLRSPGFVIPFLLLPVPVYLFFGVLLAAPAIAKNPGIGNYLFSGFSAFAIIGPALFGVGCSLALERDAGFLRLKRALPAAGGAYLAAKMAVAVIFAALAMGSMLLAALVAGSVSLSAGQLAIIAGVMIVGALPFAAIGLFIGAYASGSAAPAYANMLFLPMLWLSGLFIPLPKFLEPWVVIWPAFHVNQVALGFAGVSQFSFMAPGISAAVLAGVTVVFGGLAIRRLARHG